MEHSDDSFRLWISFPDQLQILIGGWISENGVFISIPYILLAHHPKKGQAAKGQDFVVIVIVQKQVNDQLRQLGIDPSSSNSTGTNAHPKACAQISRACLAAGFVAGQGNTGNRVFPDCVVPLMDGTPQPQNATIPLPQVNPNVIAACKQLKPNYGHFLRKRSREPASDESSTESEQ